MSAGTAGQPKPKSKMWIGCAIAAGVVLCLIVPIGGIVAAIAVPNFLKFQCKSKQSEAKVELSSLYTAEQSFYAQYGFYTSDLKALSVTPGSPTPRYIVGFADAGPGARRNEAPADYDESRTDTTRFATSRVNMTSHGAPLSANDLPAGTFVEREHFVAGAAGDVGGGLELDQWTIDEKRSIQHVYDACGGGSSGRGGEDRD